MHQHRITSRRLVVKLNVTQTMCKYYNARIPEMQEKRTLILLFNRYNILCKIYWGLFGEKTNAQVLLIIYSRAYICKKIAILDDHHLQRRIRTLDHCEIYNSLQIIWRLHAWSVNSKC